MTAKLRARQPEVRQGQRMKALWYGQPGVGKTRRAMDFPGLYYIDTEDGGKREQYQRALLASGALYMGRDEGSGDIWNVIREVEALATTKHDRLTLVIDSFSHLYLTAAALAEVHVGSDFGADKKQANKPTRQLMLWIDRLDMNVILICHSKVKWLRGKGKDALVADGTTFDGLDKMEYTLDLSMEVMYDEAQDERFAVVRKTRVDALPKGCRVPWTYHALEDAIGRDVITRTAVPFVPCTPQQVQRISQLLAVVKMPDDWEDRIFANAGVATWAEMDADKIGKCIQMLEAKTAPPTSPVEPATAPKKSKKEAVTETITTENLPADSDSPPF